MANEFTSLVTKINNVARSDRNLRTALSTVLAFHKPRIFVKGQDSSGQRIGTYSKNPISISRKNQARNTGKTTFKGGYAEYHGLIGKGSTNVILRNTDQMMMDYGLQGSALNYGFGFQNKENFDKSQWMEEKYKKKIFYTSRQEEKILVNVLTAQLMRVI